MSRDVTFTGERLHAGEKLFSVDLARHEAAYRLARERLPAGRVLDFGCGSGYGAASLARAHAAVFGLDRVLPDPDHRGGCRFVCADMHHLPLAADAFDLIVSFQVLEHFEDPKPYLDAIATLLSPGGVALVTTPNLLMSDGVNPYHVHEYRADELAELLGGWFDDVEMQGIGASEPVRAYLSARSARIRRIMRLDPLGLRDLLPRGLVEWLFARFALLVRRQTQQGEGTPECSWRDFPVGPADAGCLDLLAVCRRPRSA